MCGWSPGGGMIRGRCWGVRRVLRRRGGLVWYGSRGTGMRLMVFTLLFRLLLGLYVNMLCWVAD